MASDQALVEAAVGGDRRAFEAIYHRHARFVATVVWRVYGARAEVDDAVQEAFFQAYKTLETLEKPEALGSWLARIALRHVSGCLRTRDRRSRLQNLLRPGPVVQEEAHQVEEILALRQILDTLPEPLRQAWVLQRVVELPLEQVAHACDCSVATVKRRIEKAGKRIEKRWNHE